MKRNDINITIVEGRIIEKPRLVETNNGKWLLTFIIESIEFARTTEDAYFTRIMIYAWDLYGKELYETLEAGQHVVCEGKIASKPASTGEKLRYDMYISARNVTEGGKAKTISEQARVKAVKLFSGVQSDGKKWETTGR